MRGIKYAGIGLLGLILAACTAPQKSQTEEVSEESKSQLPPLTTLEGQQLTLQPSTQLLMLNIWATWCKPCIEEMPDLETLQSSLPAGVTLLLASEEESARIKSFLAKRDFRLTFLRVSGNLDALGVYSLPTTLFFNADGQLIATWVGVRDWTSEAILDDIKKMINQ